MTTRTYEAVVNQALLMASPAQEVFNFLKNRSEQKEDNRFEKEADKELELSLLSRNDPLINLALAKYGAYSETLQKLFKHPTNTDQGKALRYCLLSNRTKGAGLLDDLPSSLFSRTEEQLDYFKQIGTDEIYVLFQNPKISDNFLRDFFEGDEHWEVLDEERRLKSLEGLIYNERITTPYDDSFMDGYADYSYHAVFDALWKLAETLPVDDIHASRLCWVYDKLIANSFSVKEPLEVAKRWTTDDKEQQEREVEENERGYLSHYQGVRKGLARLFKESSRVTKVDLINSEDVAFRSAVYSSGRLSPEQINDCYQKDGELFFNEAVRNERLWREKETREALRQVAWAVVQADKHSDLMGANIYNHVAEDMAKKHPDWFIGDEDTPATSEPEDAPATKGDLNQIALSITQVTTNLVQETIQKMSKQVAWIWWFSLGAFVATILKH